MAISASWQKDSTDSSSFEGYVVRNGIDSPSTGYRFDNLGLVYLDKNFNKKLDPEDLVIGSIVDTQSGGSGTLRQDSSQPTLYAIKDSDNASKSAGIAVIFDADFNSGKAVAPPAPKVTATKSTGSTTGSSSGSASTGTSTSPIGSTAGSTGTSTSPIGSTAGSTGTSTSPIVSTAGSTGTSTSPIGSTAGSTATSSSPIGAAPGTAGSNSSVSTIPQVWEKLKPTTPSFIADVVSYFIPSTTSAATQQLSPVGKQLDLGGFDLNYTADVTTVIKAKSTGGDVLKTPDSSSTPSISMLLGDKGNDIIRGGTGSDLVDGGAGNDIIKAGDGDDIITGGPGADQIWGGFGKNIFLNEKDGSIDRLYITSDQYVPNPNLNNKINNNADGHNVDTIKALDSFDKINILGVSNQDLSFFQTVAPSGVQGIGIYAKGTLEAIYTGGDLSVQQIRSMTTGLASGYADVLNSI